MSPRRPEHVKCANCMAYEPPVPGTDLRAYCRRSAPIADRFGFTSWPATVADSWCAAFIPDLPTQRLMAVECEGRA